MTIETRRPRGVRTHVKLDRSTGESLYRTFRPGTIAHHHEMMLVYEAQAFELMAKVAAYTADLKDKLRRQNPNREEKTIQDMVNKDLTRKGLIDDQAWYDRLTMREAAVLDALLNKARFEKEFGEISAEVVARAA